MFIPLFLSIDIDHGIASYNLNIDHEEVKAGCLKLNRQSRGESKAGSVESDKYDTVLQR